MSGSSSSKTYKVGDVLEGVKTVQRPGGGETAVTDGLYVLDVEGTFLVDGNEVTVK